MDVEHPVGGGAGRVSSQHDGGWDDYRLSETLAPRAGVDILAAIATLIDAAVVAAFDATKDVASGRANNGAHTGTNNGS